MNAKTKNASNLNIQEELNLPTLSHNERIPDSSDQKSSDEVMSPDASLETFQAQVKGLSSCKFDVNSVAAFGLPDGGLGNLKFITEVDKNEDEASEFEHDKEKPIVKRRGRKKQKVIPTDELVVPPSLAEERRTWNNRAACMFAFLHPNIGHKDYNLTADLASVSCNTLRGWITKINLMAKWVSFLQDMTAKDAALILGLDLVKLGVSPEEKVDVSDYVEVLKKKNLTPVKMESGLKRVQSRPRCSKWNPQFLYGKALIDKAWENGLPMDIRRIKDALLDFFSLENAPREQSEADSRSNEQFAHRYLDATAKNYPTLLNTLISRIISRSGFVVRSQFLEEKLPFNWKNQAENISRSFLDFYRHSHADVLVATDEAFYSTSEENFRDFDASGYVVAVSCAMPPCELLPPFVVIKHNEDPPRSSNCFFAKTKDAMVDHTVMRAIMKSLKEHFSGKKVVWILDRSSSHVGQDFEQSLEIVNSDGPGEIMPFYIPDGFTQVFNMPWLVFEHPIREQLASFVPSSDSEHAVRDIKYVRSAAHPKTSLKDFCFSLQRAWTHLQDSSSLARIENGFSLCGLNPSETRDVTRFQQHIEGLVVKEESIAPKKRQKMFNFENSVVLEKQRGYKRVADISDLLPAIPQSNLPVASSNVESSLPGR